jgi:hypothetical protein
MDFNLQERCNNCINNINDPVTRQVVIEGYNATLSLGFESLFANNDITEELIFRDERFKVLCMKILASGGSDHSGASMGIMCAHLSRIFRGN